MPLDFSKMPKKPMAGPKVELGNFHDFNIGFRETKDTETGISYGNFDIIFDVPGDNRGMYVAQLRQAIETNRLHEELKTYNPKIGGIPLRLKSNRQMELLMQDIRELPFANKLVVLPVPQGLNALQGPSFGFMQDPEAVNGTGAWVITGNTFNIKYHLRHAKFEWLHRLTGLKQDHPQQEGLCWLRKFEDADRTTVLEDLEELADHLGFEFIGETSSSRAQPSTPPKRSMPGSSSSSQTSPSPAVTEQRSRKSPRSAI